MLRSSFVLPMLSNLALLSTLALPAQTTSHTAAHHSTAATAHHTAAAAEHPAPASECVTVPTLPATVPALPTGAPCAKALFTIVEKVEYMSPMVGPEVRQGFSNLPMTISLDYIETQIGTGELIKPHMYLTVQYTGYLTDGTKFDSSLDRPAKTFTFPYGGHRVIPGLGCRLRRHARRRQAKALYPLPVGLRRSRKRAYSATLRADLRHGSHEPERHRSDRAASARRYYALAARLTPRHAAHHRPGCPCNAARLRAAATWSGREAGASCARHASHTADAATGSQAATPGRLLTRTAQGRTQTPMFQRLSPLFPYLRRYWRSFALGGLALVIYNCAKAMIPLLVGTAIDDMRRNIHAAAVWQHALELLGVAIVSAICLYLTRQIIIGASREIEFDLRNDLFTHLERQPPSFFQRNRTGDIMARSTNDLSAVRQLLGPAIMYSANTVVFTAAALPFMLRISPRLTHVCVSSAALRVGPGAVLRRSDPHALRAHPGHVLGHLRAGGGELLRRAPDPCLRPGGGPDRGLRDIEPRVHPPQPATRASDGNALAHTGAGARASRS